MDWFSPRSAGRCCINGQLTTRNCALPPNPRFSGPCTCLLLAAVLRGGKRQFGGKVAYAGSIRNRETLLCAHGALGRDLVQRFTLRGALFPNPSDTDIWRHTPLWPGNNPKASISYQQHADVLRGYLKKAGVFITKVGKVWRKGLKGSIVSDW